MISADKEYASLSTRRTGFLDRAWDGSEVTIPFILPRDQQKDQDLPTPFQSIGARGVNNLAAKLLLTLYPPNSPFFKFQIDDFTLEELTQTEGQRGVVEEGLNAMERAVSQEVEAKSMRVPLYECLRHLIITGNCVVHVNEDNKLRVFHLDQFVCSRDPQGEVIKIIIEEEISRTVFMETFGFPIPGDKDSPEIEDRDKKNKNVKLYTVIHRKKGMYYVHQEIKGHIIPKSQGKFPLDKVPWLALRFSSIDGEDYGRGFVEEYLGDLNALEGLSQAILEGSMAAAKAIFLVRPNGTTNPRTISQAPNLAVRQGVKDDVSVIQLDKFNDFRVARETLEGTERRLAAAFLLNQSVQRDAERVTAEEIRFLANELESSLGGIYSLLSHELQLPHVKLMIAALEKNKKLPTLPKDTVKPIIVTGFEALGRGNDANKLATFLQTSAQIVTPQGVLQYLQVGETLKRLGVGFGIDMKGLIKSDEDVQAAAQQQQQMAMMSDMAGKLGPTAIKEGSNLMQQGNKNGEQTSEAN